MESTVLAGSICLRLKNIDLVTRVGIDVKSAMKCIDRVVRYVKRDDSIQGIGSLFEMADKVVGIVDDVVSVGLVI